MRRDTLHLKAPGNWINDPNGFIYYKGKYHLFYQHFPYAPVWGTMHWGHAVSEDLVNWEHLGIALFPTRYEDQNGCFSGSAIEHEGRMYLYYTGVHYMQADPNNIHLSPGDAYESAQLMMTSEDGMHFDNFHKKTVIVPPMDDSRIGDRTHTRDPKVWRGRDAWYMVLGTMTAKRKGALLFYRSENLNDWSYVNTVSANEELGWMWECPDCFEVAGKTVLIVSPMGLQKQAPLEENHTVCMQVTFEEETCVMQLPDHYQYLDYGLDLYAPQSTLDEEGRRVLVAWLRMPEPVEGEWIGMYCMPRVVEMEGGHICFRVHPYAESMFTRKITHPKQADGAAYRVRFVLREGEGISIGGYRIWREENRICTDRSAVFPRNEKFSLRASTPEVEGKCELDVYVDAHMIEIFVNRGRYVLSHAVYGLTDEIQSDSVEQWEIAALK